MKTHILPRVIKWILILVIAGGLMGVAALTGIYIWYSKGLPDVSTIDDYNPKKISQVFDRKGKMIGEFFDVEKRKMVSEADIPDYLEQAFMAAEDSEFYDHGGVNLQAIFRAAIKNFMAGRTVQGGSTITQQVVKKIFLTDERSLERKIKEAILALRLERKFDKNQILNLYLNHIYLGEGAYGVEMAAQTYFRKSVKELEIKEAAILAGLTSRPSKNSPLKNPKAAKRRQKYVLQRMAEEGYISQQEAEEAAVEPLKVYFAKQIEKRAPYFVEVLRQVLVEEVGEKALLQEGLKITTSLDLDAQQAAQKAMQKGLRELDKRQGYRGAKQTFTTKQEVKNFLEKSRNDQIKKFYEFMEVDENGEVIGRLKDPLNLSVFKLGSETEKKSNLPDYIKKGAIIDAIVTKVSDQKKVTEVRFGEYRGVILFESMKWARKPNPDTHYKYSSISRPSQALKKGDVIQVKVVAPKLDYKTLTQLKGVGHIESHALLELEQDPAAQGALLSFDQKTGEIIAMVGGYDFKKSKYNRTYQALRQTGSAFKPVVYAAALDKGYSPVSELLDIPMVFEEVIPVEESLDGETTRKYKPSNHGNDFSGDVIFRQALVRSMNVPTMQIIKKIGVPWALNYARRLGIFSPLNPDITLALGSSGVTLYEMTKVFSQFGRLGKALSPLLVRSVEDLEGNAILTDYKFDKKFEKEIQATKDKFQKVVFDKLKFGDQSEVFPKPEGQLITPQTAYVMTNILHDVIYGNGGTAAKARVLNRPAAGKTGTTSAYYDAWFVGYTAQISTGVWVGFDKERTLGRGETGGSAALPIWTEYMLGAHKDLPKEDFKVPSGIVFSNIDIQTGKVASASSTKIAKQAFREGFNLAQSVEAAEQVDEKDLFEEDFAEE